MSIVWLALSYNLPANPSKSRVYVWRKLREWGAETVRPGMALLPPGGENEDLFRQLALRIRTLGGESSVLELRFLEEEEELRMIERFRLQTQQRWAKLQETAAKLSVEQEDQQQKRTGPMAQLHRQAESLFRQMEQLSLSLGEVAGELGGGVQQMREMMAGLAGDFSSWLREAGKGKKS